jgi:putative transposase
MGLARSTYYDEPAGQPIEEARLIERIKEICAEWPCYGYRRVTAQLDAEGILVNHKKVMRLMREHGLTVRLRRRFVATTDSDHDGPIFQNLAKDVVPTGPNQLWSPTSPTSPSRPASSIWRPFSMLGRGALWATPSADVSTRGSR